MLQQIVNSLASICAEAEALIHHDAVILSDFPRSIQLDDYSCSAKSIYGILQYYGKQCTPESVEEQLHTDEDGTDASDIKRVFRRYHLNYRILRQPGLRDLKAAINNGCPILVSLYDGDHYAVVYGYSDSHIFVSNPSLNGSIRCAITKSEFMKIWDRWGVIINE
jgi:ABC-type bacteriocin/lantibiotic exporter with double-glycine peptidase domain